jgi:hypothetical protein
VGPFGYSKRTYKYDVSFDPTDSSSVTFKEYILLEAVADPTACTRMYHRLGNDFEALTDPCVNGACDCLDASQMVTIVNPLYGKLEWQESSQELMARYSSAVFVTIQELLLTEFITAVKMHIIKFAYQEIYFFRLMNMVGTVFKTGIDYLRVNYNTTSGNLTDQELFNLLAGTTNKLPSYCGLSIYKISDCPLYAMNRILAVKSTQFVAPASFNTATDFPSLASWFNESSSVSFLNYWGLPKIVGFAFCIGSVTFNAATGYTMINSTDCAQIESEVYGALANATFGTNMTANQKLGTKIMTKGFLDFMFNTFYTAYTKSLYNLIYEEFGYTYEPVPCSPLGDLCMYQFGYMNKYRGSSERLSANMSYDLIDYRANGNTQPNNFIYDANTGPLYNTYRYCSVVYVNPDNYDKCLNISYTFNDALKYQPAGLWGVDNGISGTDTTLLYSEFAKQSAAVKLRYQQLACNVTTLLYEVYPSVTDFHDKFVIKYLNRKKDTAFPHLFNFGQWVAVAYAQWGGGYVTYAAVGVR